VAGELVPVPVLVLPPAELGWRTELVIDGTLNVGELVTADEPPEKDPKFVDSVSVVGVDGDLVVACVVIVGFLVV